MIKSRGTFIFLYPNGDIVFRQSITKEEFEKINQAGVKFTEIELTEGEKLFIKSTTTPPFDSIIGKIIKAVVDLGTKDFQNILKHK